MEMTRTRTLVALVCAVVVALGVAYVAAPAWTWPEPMTIPEEAVLVEERGVGCSQPFYPEVIVLGFDLDGTRDLVEFRVVFLVYRNEPPVPVVWIYYDGPRNADGSSEAGRVYLTLPNTAPERLSYDELVTRYPTPCRLWSTVSTTST